MVRLYTDGASRGNPGPGGYAAILTCGGYEKVLSAAFHFTTNNRMELLAVIVGLEALRRPAQRVVVYTDSKYVVDPVGKGWLQKWQKEEYRKKKNVDLWKRFCAVYARQDVELVWIEGHAGHSYNERCDKIAVERALGGPWESDHGYKRELGGGESC